MLWVKIIRNNDTLTCQYVSDKPNNSVSFTWNTGETTQTISYVLGASYYCAVSDTSDVVYGFYGYYEDLGIPFLCSYQWDTGETTQSITIDNDYDVHYCKATDSDGNAIYGYYDLFSTEQPELNVLTATYQWDTGETTQSITIDNDYNVHYCKATDSNGNVIYGYYDLYIDVPASEIVLPVTYKWSTGETTQAITTNSTNLTDVYYCTTTDILDRHAIGYCDLFSTEKPEIPLLTATYQWDTGETTQSITIDNDYDVHYCKATDSNGNVIYGYCDLMDDYVVSFDYLWSTNETSQSIDAGQGIYTVTVTNNFGISTDATITLQAPVIILASPISVEHGEYFTVNANVSDDGNIESYSWSAEDLYNCEKRILDVDTLNTNTLNTLNGIDVYQIHDTKYTLTVTDNDGFTTEKSVIVGMIEPIDYLHVKYNDTIEMIPLYSENKTNSLNIKLGQSNASNASNENNGQQLYMRIVSSDHPFASILNCKYKNSIMKLRKFPETL